MKLSDVADGIETGVKTKIAVFLTGEAGIGKSAIVKQVADKLGLQFRDVRAVLLDAVDIRGLPHVNGDGRAHWAIPEFLPRDGEGILFLDELNRAPMLVQNACLQLTLDRKVGEYTLPEGWAVVAAGNPDVSRGVTRMGDAHAGRFMHFEVEADVNDFAEWASKSGVRPEVVAFVRFRPELIHKFVLGQTEKPFPSPRSWHFVSRILDSNPKSSIEHACIEGVVGKGAAAEFVGFLKIYRNLPNLDAIIKDPKNAPVPSVKEVATLWATMAGLSRKATKANFAAIITYAERMPKEFAVALLKDATGRDKGLCETAGFIKWSVANQGIMS